MQQVETTYICQQKFNDEHICTKGPKPNLIGNH